MQELDVGVDVRCCLVADARQHHQMVVIENRQSDPAVNVPELFGQACRRRQLGDLVKGHRPAFAYGFGPDVVVLQLPMRDLVDDSFIALARQDSGRHETMVRRQSDEPDLAVCERHDAAQCFLQTLINGDGFAFL